MEVTYHFSSFFPPHYGKNDLPYDSSFQLCNIINIYQITEMKTGCWKKAQPAARSVKRVILRR